MQHYNTLLEPDPPATSTEKPRRSQRHLNLELGLWLTGVALVIGIGLVGLSNRPSGSLKTAQAASEETQTAQVSTSAQPSRQIIFEISHPTLFVTDPEFQQAVTGLAEDLVRVKPEKGAQTIIRVENYTSARYGEFVQAGTHAIRLAASLSGGAEQLIAWYDAARPVLQSFKEHYPGFSLKIASEEILNFKPF